MAISFVNSTGAQIATAASTWSLAIPAVTAGGTIIVGIGQPASTSGASTVTDNAGNTYLKIAKATEGGAVLAAEMWYATNVSASTRISVTMNASSSGSIASAHFTGISTGSPLGPSGSSGAKSSAVSASNITPTAAGVVVQFSRFAGNTIAISTTANFTGWISTNIANFQSYGQYWIQGSPTATAGAFTVNTSLDWASVIAVFYDTNGGAAPTVILPWSMSLMGVA